MSRERILVIDDSPTILKLVQLALTKADYRVITAPDGQTGLAAARQERPQLVLLDLLMPEMDGASVAAALAKDPALAAVPVVMMSARRQEEDLKANGSFNVVDAIRKPFSPEALLAVVSHVLAKQTGAEPDTDAVDLGSLAMIAVETPPVEVESGAAALAGDLRVVALADVMALLADEGQTGLLHIQRGGARVRVFFHKGLIDFGSAEGIPEDFLLGRFLVKTGALDQDTLVAALEARQSLPPADGEASLLGSFLVHRGLVSAPDLARALSLQTSALVFEALRWGAGRFRFEQLSELPAQAREAALGQKVAALLLEGFRRVDEWRLIERDIGDFDEIFVREEERLSSLGQGRLSREELAALELCDGRRNVRDILERSPLGAFDTTKMLYRLLRLRLIRRRVPPIGLS
jgi:CheY-like chemotaxis protein